MDVRRNVARILNENQPPQRRHGRCHVGLHISTEKCRRLLSNTSPGQNDILPGNRSRLPTAAPAHLGITIAHRALTTDRGTPSPARGAERTSKLNLQGGKPPPPGRSENVPYVRHQAQAIPRSNKTFPQPSHAECPMLNFRCGGTPPPELTLVFWLSSAGARRRLKPPTGPLPTPPPFPLAPVRHRQM